jgi:hypothetical protein
VKLSSYFYDLRSAYQAELDDLVSDSEGKDVLRKRLAEKRSEIGFLVKMMELAPEMVAVVFHQGFRFAKPSVMEHLLSQGADNLPEWGTLTGAVSLEPWAASLAQTVLREPGGPLSWSWRQGWSICTSMPAWHRRPRRAIPITMPMKILRMGPSTTMTTTP